MKYEINMLSKADMVKGQGVLSAYLEQFSLVNEGLPQFHFAENSLHQYDVTHYHTINFDFYVRRWFRKHKEVGICSVHFLPETVENSLQLPFLIKKVFYWYLIQFYKSMDILVTVNPLFIEMLGKYGIPARKIVYIPNYVSEKDFYPMPAEQKNKRKAAFGLPQDRFLVLSVGQLQTRKGVMEFIELARDLPQYHFAWAGNFAFGKISKGQKQIEQAMQDLPENVSFLGLVPRERMNELYNAADVMFQPSFEELFPMTILEAMSAHIPLLLRDLEEYKGILSGFYLKGTNNQEFAEALNYLQNPANYRKAVEQSAAGSQKYNRENVLKKWAAFYNRAWEMKQKKLGWFQMGKLTKWAHRAHEKRNADK